MSADYDIYYRGHYPLRRPAKSPGDRLGYLFGIVRGSSRWRRSEEELCKKNNYEDFSHITCQYVSRPVKNIAEPPGHRKGLTDIVYPADSG